MTEQEIDALADAVAGQLHKRQQMKAERFATGLVFLGMVVAFLDPAMPWNRRR